MKLEEIARQIEDKHSEIINLEMAMAGMTPDGRREAGQRVDALHKEIGLLRADYCVAYAAREYQKRQN